MALSINYVGYSGNYDIYVSQTSPSAFEGVNSFDSLIVDTPHSMTLSNDNYSYVKLTATTNGKMYFYTTTEIDNDDNRMEAYLYHDYDSKFLLAQKIVKLILKQEAEM